MTSSSAPSFSASHAAGPPAWRSRTRRFPRRSADRRSRAERTGAGDPAALRAAVRVPGRGLFEVDPGLVRQRHEPGQDVRDLLGPLRGIVAAESPGQLTDLLDEAAEGAVATATLVAVEIRSEKGDRISDGSGNLTPSKALIVRGPVPWARLVWPRQREIDISKLA